MDEPHEVNAAAGRFAGAIETVSGQVSGTVSDLVLHHRPGSALDRTLDTHRQGIVTAFGNALAASNRGARATHTATVSTTNVLSAADVQGGADIQRYDSI
ncbi:hypothetical protein OIE68_20005 [Nocardia vinacea]|uniref:hypothetical protein n=1 Tax=Nocardia vinacea TaxID=96468 RepID=UPI002E136201|nr:hypothetical protein OIE68_20005 [Nocardia vinacea]